MSLVRIVKIQFAYQTNKNKKTRRFYIVMKDAIRVTVKLPTSKCKLKDI